MQVEPKKQDAEPVEEFDYQAEADYRERQAETFNELIWENF